jgi:ATP-dependent RNA circularization protein (DNA/RNA ligase family)
MSPTEINAFLAGEVVVEEKLDGANLGFSIGLDGELRAQNRGQYLTEPYTGQFARLPTWLAQHGDDVASVLTPDLMLFGEWCAARHSLSYSAMPDWFLLFDVYDHKARKFWNTQRRNALASTIRLATVPELTRAKFTLAELITLVDTQISHYRAGSVEGIVIRRDSADWCEGRAKLVHPDFTQAIGGHWRKRSIEWNHLAYEATFDERGIKVC